MSYVSPEYTSIYSGVRNHMRAFPSVCLFVDYEVRIPFSIGRWLLAEVRESLPKVCALAIHSVLLNIHMLLENETEQV